VSRVIELLLIGLAAYVLGTVAGLVVSLAS
jgi:hypothetical protein